MLGTRFIRQALDKFHAKHNDIKILLDVTRRPYSWAGDDTSVNPNKISYRQSQTEEDRHSIRDDDNNKLQGKSVPDDRHSIRDDDNNKLQGKSVPDIVPIQQLGDRCNLQFNFNVQMKWHPVESQRLTAYAAKVGKQEHFVSEMSKLHFEQEKSCADRENLLEAIEAAGMNVEDANTFLNTDEGEAAVWKSYGDLIKRYRIKEIPVFTFTTGLSPFDPSFKSGIGIQPYVVVGSSSVDLYVSILERLYQGIPPTLETIDSTTAANNSNSKI